MTAPILHSRLGAAHTLCLAFDRWSIANWMGYSNINIPSYGGSSADIIAIHSRVGSLYAPFDVDVTTVLAQPELNKVGLAAIGGLNGWYNSPQPFWGITYPGSFFSPVQSYPGLSFVASDDIGTPFQVAAVIAHEFGHQCGLNHQITNGQPTPGAIMGQTYGSNDGWIVGTNENGERQDDVAILASHLGLANMPSNPGSAAFVSTDTTTQGNWQSIYGSDGYNLSQGAESLPPYVQLSLAGNNDCSWSPSTNDRRALQKPSDRLSACWYSSGSFTIDLNLAAGQTHQVSLYLLDWDSYLGGRSQKLEVIDTSTGQVLDTRIVSSFSGGQYVTWTLGGHVQIRVTNLAASDNNSVLSGIFFGGA